MKLSNIQKITILAVVLIAIILGAVSFVIYANKQSAKKITSNVTQNAAQNTDQTPTTTVPVVTKNYNQIVKDINTKVTAGTATADDFIDLGVAYYNLGTLDKAIEAYTQATIKDPQSAHAYANLGNIYRDQSEFTKAEQSYKTAIQFDPKTSKYYIGLAFLYNSLMDDKASAIGILNQGLIAIPNDPDMTKLLGDYNK